MSRRPSIEQTRTALVVLAAFVMAAAVCFQRAAIGSAFAEMRSMSVVTVTSLVVLGVIERVTRADIFRRLLGMPTFAQALTIHDVGAAASKGIPLGGPVSTGLRWTIARDADIPTNRLASAMVASGVATTFVTWTLPFVVLGLDVTQRPATTTDVVMLAVAAIVLVGSLVFWSVVLTSEAVGVWMTRWVARMWLLVGRRSAVAQRHDPAASFVEVRTALRSVGRRPGGLLARTVLAHSCGAVILLVALRGVGVGAELGAVEFARVFFVVGLLSSFVPLPGGVGVVEAGLTGALVAAGVAPTAALAGVLVYRLLTHVTPIVVGAVLYIGWRWRPSRRTASAGIA